MTDLEKLIASVEAGTWEDTSTGYRFAVNGWGNIIAARAAYDGSLDAAKCLHDALLPGWKWGAHEPRPGVFRAYVSPWSALRPVPDTAEADTPARAWLLSILKALKAKGKV